MFEIEEGSKEELIKYKKSLMESIKLTRELSVGLAAAHRGWIELILRGKTAGINSHAEHNARDALFEARVMDRRLETLNKALNRVTQILNGEPCDFKKEKKDLLKNIKEREDIRTCLL